LRLKQGFGRLIRTASDRGVVAILDSRLLSKGYGRQIIKALPPCGRADSIEAVKDWFNRLASFHQDVEIESPLS
jgi:ATP-dependent DNA helicase DinG